MFLTGEEAAVRTGIRLLSLILRVVLVFPVGEAVVEGDSLSALIVRAEVFRSEYCSDNPDVSLFPPAPIIFLLLKNSARSLFPRVFVG